MYSKHFGLTAAPFRITPDTRRFFGGGQRAEILDTLLYAIVNGEGMVKVSGEIGTGKTMLCHMLQAQLPPGVEVAYLANPGLTSKEIVTAIAMELQLPVAPDTPPLHLRQQLLNHLLQAHRHGRQVVVFVEEAQLMPLRTLEEIRLLSNLETGRAKLLQLVLFGQPELNQRLEQHDIRQLRDRITHHFDLRPLNTDEIRDYVRFRLHSAGYTGNELFTGAAYRRLAATSGGRIRRLHVLADKALLAAFARGDRRVRWRHVRRAAREDAPLRRRSLCRPSAALIGGLMTGLVLAVGAAQFDYQWPLPAVGGKTTAPAPNSQSIDDARRVALHTRPAAGGLPVITERLQASERWMADPDTSGLTIQLLLSDDADLSKLEKVLSDQPYRELLPQIYLSRTVVEGRQRWSVLYGEFSSKTKALEVLADLPERVQIHHPYLRSLNGLREQRSGEWLTHKDEQG